MKTELLMNEINSTQKAFCRRRQGYFSALMEMFWTDNMNEGTEVTTSL
jgi:hypothetical protein